jgi:hypothetical protein
MNDIVAAHADTAIHVILDNLNYSQAQERPLAQASSERLRSCSTDVKDAPCRDLPSRIESSGKAEQVVHE